MTEAVEVNERLVDLVRIEAGWLPSDVEVMATEYFSQLAPEDEYWTLTSRKTDVKSERGHGIPLVHWYQAELNRTSQLVGAENQLPEFIDVMARMVQSQFGINPNSIQANLYEDGYGLVWHSDENPKVPFKGDKTVTIRIGASRVFAVAMVPEEWGGKKLQPDEDDLLRIQPIDSWVLSSGDCAVYDNRLHSDFIHGVLPGPGTSYGITFREY